MPFLHSNHVSSKQNLVRSHIPASKSIKAMMKTTQVAVQFLAPQQIPKLSGNPGHPPPPRRRKARQGPRVALRPPGRAPGHGRPRRPPRPRPAREPALRAGAASPSPPAASRPGNASARGPPACGVEQGCRASERGAARKGRVSRDRGDVRGTLRLSSL